MLIIKKGGLLIEKDENGKERDVTHEACRSLFDTCELEDNLTLRDIFLLLNKDLKFYDLVFASWTEEIVTEGLTRVSNADDREIEYLELKKYGEFDIWEDRKEFNGFDLPSFHGVGKDTDGIEIGYAIELQPVSEIIDLPIKLNKEVKVYEVDYRDKKNYPRKEYNFGECSFTLSQILYGIMWELSFFGSPENRDKMSSEILNRAEEAKKQLEEENENKK